VTHCFARSVRTLHRTTLPRFRRKSNPSQAHFIILNSPSILPRSAFLRELAGSLFDPYDLAAVNQNGTIKQTGSIWRSKRTVRTNAVARVCALLEREYGRPRFGNPRSSLGNLIYIVISNKTSPRTAQATYRRLRGRFKAWDDVLRAPASALRKVLKPAGLAQKKSKYIRTALERIKQDFGSCNLAALRKVAPRNAHEYLVSLPGVSDKVAKCVLMYTLDAPVLPVDSHVHRIANRLGWTARKRADQSHEELEALVRPSKRFAFHVDCIAHGRLICRPEKPICYKCCINRYCAYFRRLNR
jgi:endonuclease-3